MSFAVLSMLFYTLAKAVFNGVCYLKIFHHGNKKIKGRKRHIIVDKLGLLLCIVITSANVHDGVAAESIFEKMKGKFPRLKKILADGGYAGERLFNLARSSLKAVFEVVTQSEEVGFKVTLVPSFVTHK